MKNLHRTKALDAYEGARIVLKEGLVYPSYMLLKESTRSTLAYIIEDIQGKEYSEKTKLHTLLEEVPAPLVTDNSLNVFKLFVDMDSAGLNAILSLSLAQLNEIKHVLKKLIGMYLHTHV